MHYTEQMMMMLVIAKSSCHKASGCAHALCLVMTLHHKSGKNLVAPLQVGEQRNITRPYSGLSHTFKVAIALAPGFPKTGTVVCITLCNVRSHLIPSVEGELC